MVSKFFVEDKFEQMDGTIGNTSYACDSETVAKMEFHSKCASHYVPENYNAIKWATVTVVDNLGGYVCFERVKEEEPEE